MLYANADGIPLVAKPKIQPLKRAVLYTIINPVDLAANPYIILVGQGTHNHPPPPPRRVSLQLQATILKQIRGVGKMSMTAHRLQSGEKHVARFGALRT